jgi:starvation-inducible outer membrane lipoprotein
MKRYCWIILAAFTLTACAQSPESIARYAGGSKCGWSKSSQQQARSNTLPAPTTQ